MTGKELTSLIGNINDLKTRIIDEFEKRLKELAAIAKEKGITTFGYQGPTPDEWDDIEDDDFDEDEAYDAMEENVIGFRWGARYFNGYRFYIYNDNAIMFTLLEEFYGGDFDDGEIINDANMYFNPEEAANYIRCGAIIEMIESQLGL